MLALAALSARALAGWAAADGAPAIVLDVFGDTDTRAAARAWHRIGGTAPPRIDGPRLLAALRTLAARGEADAWVAGSGFEADPALLAQAAGVLPLRGTAPSDQARLADPGLFFGALDAFGIAHPPVTFTPPAAGGWLRKRARSAGGWGIDRRREAAPGVYWQRERAGHAMSATFVANGDRAAVLGFNRMATVEVGERPFVFAGACGPVPLPARARHDVLHALAALVPAFGLRGLGSVDFVVGDADGERDGERGAELLEVNARPSASAALYPDLGGHSPLLAHLRACREGELPAVPAPQRGRALRIVFARRSLKLDAAGAARVAAAPGATDLPAPGTTIMAGEPVCTLHTDAADAETAAAALQHAEHGLLGLLESVR